MAVDAHPASETLAAFARGELPQAELSTVAEHVAGCAACLASLKGIPDDSLTALARAAARSSAAATTAFDKPIPSNGIPDALVDHPRYRILGELGSGGMGVVYKAEDQIMGRTVALKVMTPHLTAKANAVERFRQEVRAAARLIHPNIVTAFDAGEAGGRHFLVMEYVEGVSLDRYVSKKGPLSVRLAALFAWQAALGLQHASEKGMVHRDIKPQNLMINKRKHLKVMDFGLARFASSDGDEPTRGRLPFGSARPVVDTVTNPNLLLGTPDYLSPEQARNSSNVDTRSDVYSLGCTLFFLLTGKAPFASAVSLIDKLLAHTKQPPPPVQGLRPEVPAELAAVVAKMMAKKPADRYATPADAAEALEPFTHRIKAASDPSDAGTGTGFAVGEAAVITPTPTESPLPLPSEFEFDTPNANAPTLTESERPRKRRAKPAAPWWKRPWAALGAAALGGLLVAAVLFVVMNGKKGEPSSGDDTAKNQPAAANPSPKERANPRAGAGKAKGVKVLYVVPSEGASAASYLSIGRKLEQAGIAMDAASGSGSARSDGAAIPVAKKLADVQPADYAAVIFAGGEIEEYVSPFRLTGHAVKRLLDSARQNAKPIAAICTGEAVLAFHHVVDGRNASHSELFRRQFPGLDDRAKITWVREPVVVDGAIITAGNANDGDAFADAILKALKSD